jgi:hypothetical protein
MNGGDGYPSTIQHLHRAQILVPGAGMMSAAELIVLGSEVAERRASVRSDAVEEPPSQLTSMPVADDDGRTRNAASITYQQDQYEQAVGKIGQLQQQMEAAEQSERWQAALDKLDATVARDERSDEHYAAIEQALADDDVRKLAELVGGYDDLLE